MARDFRFGGTDVRPGTHGIARVAVTTRLDGAELTIPVHVVRGAKDGPTLTLVSAMHGSEWFSIRIVEDLIAKLRPAELTGTFIGIPVANPIALERFTRMTPDESDEPDLNRVWPGGTTWVTEQIAAALDRDVLSRTDYLIDVHTGPWGASLAAVGYGQDLPDRDVVRRSLELAVAFGCPSIRALKVMVAFPGPRSIAGHAGSARGIPNIGPNLGGAGFAPNVEAEWLRANVDGTLNAMRHLGMISGRPSLPPRFFHFESRGLRVVPGKGGLLRPDVGPDALGKDVQKGQRLGVIVSPYTFEVIEELIAPVDGVLFGVGRDYPVRPGDWAFFVADGTHPGSRWVDAGRSVAETADAIMGGHAPAER